MNFRAFQWRSLKTRVTLLTLATFVAGIWMLAFYASRMLQQEMQRQLGEQQLATASFIAGQINFELDERLRELEAVAARISPALLNDTEALQASLEQRVVFQTQFNGGTFATRLDGTATASTPLSAKRRGINYSDRDWMSAALHEGKATIGRPVIGRQLHVPIFVMAAPIRNARGEVIGVLAGVTNLDMPNFLDKIGENGYGKAGTYLLAAPQHNVVVTSSDKSRIMGPLPAPGVSPLDDKFAQGDEGFGVLVNFRGEEELVASKRVPVAGWVMDIAQPVAEALAPVRAVQQRVLWAALLATVLAGGLTWWMLRRQLSPIFDAVQTLAGQSQADQPPRPLPITRQDEIGQLIGGFNRLIETLARREDALKESEARFRCLTEMSSDFYWESDAEHRITQRTAIKAGPENESLRREMFIGMLRWEVPSLSPDEAGWRAHRALLDAHLPFREFEVSRIGHDGAVQHVFLSGDPVFDASGHFKGYRGIGTDISERRRSEALLKEQQTQIKLAAQVFAQGREGITIADARGNIVMVNQAFTAISGYSEAELLGKSSRLLSSGRHSPAFYRAMWNSVSTKGSWAGEIWDRRKDGTDFPAWLSISTMRDEQGQITHYIGNFSDLSDVKAAETRIQWLSHFDVLTGLPNRLLLQDRTAQAITVVRRANEPLSMMLLGIDHFKRITDTLGHRIGDELLVQMAKRLSDSVRAQDTVARLDGKEFVMVLPGTSSAGVAHLAAELLGKLAQPYQLDGHELTATVSIGIATYPANGDDFDSLFKAVDIAMHRAQTQGRNTFQFYSEHMYQQVLAREHMATALRNASALDQLQLLYQPLADMQTGQISGMEALLRWQHPELGAVPPAQFIPLAEESGVIKDIGKWVLQRACRDIRAWLDKGIKVPHVAVNFSALQFHATDLIAQVQSVVSEYQIDPGLIYIEVTEGAVMDDVHRSEAALRELKDLGVKLSLDDFGTGYSSLSYLKRFPFDKVKIDQSFVRDLTTSHGDNSLVNAIISMAHDLGLKVIAEGVETEAQCEILRAHVCDEIQGYFFSRPVSAQAIEELFAEGRQLPPHLLHLRKPQRTLLLVDDEPNIVASLMRLLRRDGHIILTANSGAEGLEVLSRHRVDLIISDQRMPGMTGVEFLRAAKVNHPDTIRIVLSGYTELQSVTDAINEGAVYRFLTKPWDDEHLRKQINQAFEYKALLEENQQLDIKIRSANRELVAANRQLGEVLQKTRQQMAHDETRLETMSDALQHPQNPLIGVTGRGLTAFINAAAERLFPSEGPMLGIELKDALPAVHAAMAGTDEGVPRELQIDNTSYLVTWHTMGASARAPGKIVTLTRIELSEIDQDTPLRGTPPLKQPARPAENGAIQA